MKQFLRVAFLVAAALALASTATAQGAETYTVRLTTVPITQAMQATIAGSGSITATLTGNKLTITGNYDGLKSPATSAQVHLGQKGVRGPVLPGLDLKVSGGTRGTISGTLTLSPAQVSDLGRSRLYIQLHSERAPDGNLWGWLLPQGSRQ